MINRIGEFLNYVILGGVLLNMCLIIFNMLRELKLKCLHSRQQWVIKRRNKKLVKAKEDNATIAKK